MSQPDFQSQAGQDRFVHALAVVGEGRATGTFLDIGCNDPIAISNTYALEGLGWTGVLVDRDPRWAGVISERRRSPFVCGDAKAIDWPAMLGRYAPHVPIDYLSFDLDEDGWAGLQTFPLADVRFRILTVEHDAWRFEDRLRLPMRALLHEHGYDLLCPDVTNGGCQFEDWYVDPLVVDMTIANRFRTTKATDWKMIVGL
jgi:hypothetical protein